MVMPRNNRVVVTGVGILCPVGLDTATTWEALVCGKSGISDITLFDPTPFATRFAGEVTGFIPTDYLSRRQAQHMDRFTQLAVAASQEAVKQAAIRIDSLTIMISASSSAAVWGGWIPCPGKSRCSTREDRIG